MDRFNDRLKEVRDYAMKPHSISDNMEHYVKVLNFDDVVIHVTNHNFRVTFDPKTKAVEILLGWDKNGAEVWKIRDVPKS